MHHHDKAKLCFEELEHMAKAALQLRRNLAKETLERERLQHQLEALQPSAMQQVEGEGEEAKDEISRILGMAADLVKIKSQASAETELQRRIQALEEEVQASREDGERVRERYRDAIVSSTRSNLQTSQLMEDLSASKQECVKLDRALQEQKQRALLAMEEREAANKRGEQLVRQINQLKSQVAALEMKRVATNAANNNMATTSAAPKPNPVTGMRTVKQLGDNAKKRVQATATATAATAAAAAAAGIKRQHELPKDDFDFL